MRNALCGRRTSFRNYADGDNAHAVKQAAIERESIEITFVGDDHDELDALSRRLLPQMRDCARYRRRAGGRNQDDRECWQRCIGHIHGNANSDTCSR